MNQEEDTDRKYVGAVRKGRPNGYGTITRNDAKIYVGEFNRGKLNGQGTATWPDGRKSEGEWKNGKEWNIKGFKNEILVNEWKDGKKIDIKTQVEVAKSERKILYFFNKKRL